MLSHNYFYFRFAVYFISAVHIRTQIRRDKNIVSSKMSMFQCSALIPRSRTTSLNIDSYSPTRRLDDIIEEDNRFSSSLPARSRANTFDIAPRSRTMSEKEQLANIYNNQRRVRNCSFVVELIGFVLFAVLLLLEVK